MTIYKVVYLQDGKLHGMPYICPVYSRQYFEQKKTAEIPCALLKREDDDETVLINSFQYEVLEHYIEKAKT